MMGECPECHGRGWVKMRIPHAPPRLIEVAIKGPPIYEKINFRVEHKEVVCPTCLGRGAPR